MMRFRLGGLLVVCGVLACSSGTPENAHLRRGRELLAMKEPDAAVRELRLAQKSEPGNAQVKPLLLVALLRSDDTLTGWYEAQAMVDRLKVLKTSKLESLEGVAQLTSHIGKVRQALYDKGIDTRDSAELAAITRAAAAYSFKHAEGDEQDFGAFALGLAGDDAATAFLVERLKSDKAAYVPRLLANMGDPAIAALMRVAADAENLGRAGALDALAVLRARQAAQAIFADERAIAGLRTSDVPAQYAGGLPDTFGRGGFTRSQALYGVDAPAAADETPLRTFWIALDDRGARRLLVLQGVDPKAKQIATWFYSFEAGALLQLTPAAGPIMQRLAQEGPIVQVDAHGNGVRIRQVGKGEVPIVRETTRSSFKQGDAVRVRGNGKDGEVRGVDEFGLLLVAFTDGTRDMTLTPSALRGLETVMDVRIGYRDIDAAVTGATVTLTAASDTLIAIDDTGEDQ